MRKAHGSFNHIEWTTHYIMLMIIVNQVWQLIELWYYGEVQPSVSDTLIGIWLAWTLVQNAEYRRIIAWEEKKHTESK